MHKKLTAGLVAAGLITTGFAAPAFAASTSSDLPTVNLVAPASGSTVSGSTRFVVAATGRFPIQEVRAGLDGWGGFYGSNARRLPDGTWEYVVDTRGFSDGETRFHATADDSMGVSSEALAVPILIDNHHPTASMYSPAAGSTLSGQVSVNAATAPDSQGGQADTVDVYVDGVLVGEGRRAYNGSFEYSLDSGKFADGPHTIAVGANDGNHEPISETRQVVFANAPGAPRWVTAWPGNASAEVTWNSPDSAGGAPISQYLVTASPGGQTWTTTGTSLTADGLSNGTAYTFTVQAINSAGTGPKSEASAPTTPVKPPPAAKVSVRSVSGKSKLYVDVNPNKGSGYWTFKVQRWNGYRWYTLSTNYKTSGSGETRTLNFGRGYYRVVVKPKYGHDGATSDFAYLTR